MTSKLGLFSIIAGLVLGLFALISKFMGAAVFISTMTISTFFEGITDKIIDKISNDTVYNTLYSFFYEIHLAWVLIGLGVILLIIGTFIDRD
ncbi:hypothetical protein [uncultured Desulfobacter sp.]|jgi:p-aminobenzoyl-glutamate transporter AbgT|uniref:hypothetical protein n=1 Tax=uncultured Desulfobacter sp. TaxID=240139 RepID=UPI0029C6DC1F|nr:hypothetical protein [uncultured Desulfobacter sp.]